MSEPGLLTTAEVAHRLGIKPATVYAYVSRGRLERDPASSPRRSLFLAEAVEALAAGARRPNRSAAVEVVIETSITYLDRTGRLCYRGHDVSELARYRSFEEVTALLWEGPSSGPWELDAPAQAVIHGLRAALPADTRPPELIPLAVAALAAIDSDRADRRPEAVQRAGAGMFAAILALLGSRREPAGRDVASRMWAAFSPRTPRPAQLAAIDAVLVSLADHELAASTFAARVAASAWADPYRVVLSGLGALGGSLHGGASLAVADLLRQVGSPADAFSVLERFDAAGGVPGFGHRVYRERDPRAGQLLSYLGAVAVDRRCAARVTAVLEAAAALGLAFPNVDFALAALLEAMDLPADAAPTLFGFARIAGLLAHALEEYRHRLRFRPRATYMGPAPPP